MSAGCIVSAHLLSDLPALTQLFRAYAASLPIDLGYQGFDDELASLPGKYTPPAGALLIARDADATPLGCVAMRPLPSLEGRVSRSSLRDGREESATPADNGASAPPVARGATPSPGGEGWSVCEMKRLYVAPAGRGSGLGKKLARAIIEAARASGYREMRLDTLASMHEAQPLSRSLGFTEIAPYYDSPIAGTVFMSLKLS
jgi:putative acetyltransferase